LKFIIYGKWPERTGRSTNVAQVDSTADARSNSAASDDQQQLLQQTLKMKRSFSTARAIEVGVFQVGECFDATVTVHSDAGMEKFQLGRITDAERLGLMAGLSEMNLVRKVQVSVKNGSSSFTPSIK
jgi:hypothetical protein